MLGVLKKKTLFNYKGYDKTSFKQVRNEQFMALK